MSASELEVYGTDRQNEAEGWAEAQTGWGAHTLKDKWEERLLGFSWEIQLARGT